jgi:hypothetical protein
MLSACIPVHSRPNMLQLCGARSACRVETHLDTLPGAIQRRNLGVGRGADAARTSACATSLH